MTPHTTWTLARLAAGLPVNGDAGLLTGPARELAERLGAADPETRPTILSDLAATDDGADLVRSIADADPNGARPDPAHGWPTLTLPAASSAPPFPVEVFPAAVAEMIHETAASIGCPADFAAVAALVVAGGTIGRSVSLLLKPGYFVPPSIFAACVGNPSDGKTPALAAVAVAARRIEASLAERHREERERWQQEASRSKKDDAGPAPRPRRLTVDDATMEAVPIVLADNPRGLLMIRDELTSLILGMNQFKAGGKGSDRPTLLRIWAGDDVIRDRVSNLDGMPVRCPNPCLSIVGGLTPDMLGTMQDPKGRADGFTDRFLFTCPDASPVPTWSERGIPAEVSDAWCATVARLWSRPMRLVDGRMVPHVLHLTPDGKAAWKARYNEHSATMNAPEGDPGMRSVDGKLREYAGRLTLILTCLHHAADPTADPDSVPSAGASTVEDAWRLVSYFRRHAERVRTAAARGPGVGGGGVASAVVRWILDRGCASFTERDVKQARRWIGDEELKAALTYLAKRGAVRPIEPSGPPKRGQQPSPVWEVHPSLLSSHITRVTHESDSEGIRE